MSRLFENLQLIREENGFEKDRVARYLGVTKNTYARYESGSRTPDIETLIKLSDLFGCTVDDLVRVERSGDFISRDLVVSYRDLRNLGLSDKLSHGIVKEIYDDYSFENIPLVKEGSKIKYVYKEDVKNFLENLISKI